MSKPKIKTNNPDQPTLDDVLFAINTFSTQVEATMATMATKADLVALESRLESRLEAKLEEKLEAKLQSKMANLVTKDYLDEKLFDLRGDLVMLTRKEDYKTMKIVKLLHKKKIFSNSEAQSIMRLEPFAK